MIQIEKGVPIPKVNGSRYPWRNMEIGDSFVVTPDKYASVTQSASRAGRIMGRKFITRREGESVRVWRTE